MERIAWWSLQTDEFNEFVRKILISEQKRLKILYISKISKILPILKTLIYEYFGNYHSIYLATTNV